MSLMLPTLLTVGTFFVCYRLIVRPVLLDRTRFRIFKLRDDLRGLAIEGKIDASSADFLHTERVLCRLISLAPMLNMYQFTQFVVWEKYIPAAAYEELDLVRGKLVAVKEIERLAVRTLFWVLLINSPIGAVVMLPILGVIRVAAEIDAERKEWLRQRKLYFARKGHQFLDHDLESGDRELAAA